MGKLSSIERYTGEFLLYKKVCSSYTCVSSAIAPDC